ncbi:zinc transporter ZIP6 [Aplochiton taeniatus]
MVQHHDHHDKEETHEDHPHHHRHSNPETIQPKTLGKKEEKSAAHPDPRDTTPAALERSTSAACTPHRGLRTEGQRGRRDADSDLSQSSTPAGSPLSRQTSRALVPEEQTQNGMLSQETSLQNQSPDPGPAECQNASTILSSHGMNQETVLTLNDFGFLCPALLNQIDARACILDDRGHDHEGRDHHHHHRDHSSHDHHNSESKSITTAWVGGFVSITIISLLSLLGVVLIPLMNRTFFKFLLSFLVALAVGTLSGDAFLHLIPHSQGGHHHHAAHNDSHVHGSQDHGEEEEEEGHLDGVWKGLTALGGVYFMFLIEHFLTLGKMYKDKKQKEQKKDNGDVEKMPALEDLHPNEVDGGKAKPTASLHPGGVAEEEEIMLALPSSSGVFTAEDCENKCHSHFHDTVGQPGVLHHHHHDYHHILHHHHSQNHHPHSHSHSYSEQHFRQAGVATLAWMVIMGDGLHNFSDGLAIGAAFSEGLSSGLSTSVAVFCHELPHELGDFAVLLKAGMTVRQAILYNVLSAMMAYLGMITGILIGHYAENVSTWIFALTAGLFMYVALVDMVPEMLHNDAGDHGFSHCGFFLLQNAGILLGFCIMLLIALFEHKIQLNLD